MSEASLLEGRALQVARGRSRVLFEASIAVAAGEGVALVGPNASGKSTLVRTLAGLLEPLHGEVRVEGRPLASWPRHALARVLALVTSEAEAPDALTVLDCVALGRYPHLGPLRALGQKDRETVARALRQAGVEHLARRRLATLSAGERQLAALARGLAQEPRVLILDEPAAHLDIGHQIQLFRVLDEVRRGGVGVLAVVHDLARAAAWAERMVLLWRGQVVAAGRPSEVLVGAAAAEAFGVGIRGHAVPGLRHPLYSFEETP